MTHSFILRSFELFWWQAGAGPYPGPTWYREICGGCATRGDSTQESALVGRPGRYSCAPGGHLLHQPGIRFVEASVGDPWYFGADPDPNPDLRIQLRIRLLASVTLKGPKHEIFEIGFFTQIRPVRIGDLGTGEKKKWNFASWIHFFKVFAAKILLGVWSTCD